MGTYGDGEKRGKTGKNSRGSVKNSSRLEGLQSSRKVEGSADWGKADPRWLQAVTTAACLRGMIVSFSHSRDGGAHGLALYDQGERIQLWFNGDADLDTELEKVFEYLESLQ
jgi:hypothetical protein